MGKKFEAMGQVAFQRAPRYHAPALGGASGFGAAQPPLGATMGHGLVRHGSLKEDYFFPPHMTDLGGLSLHRSSSDATIAGLQRCGAGSARSSRGGLGGTPKGGGATPLPGAKGQQGQDQGMMRVEHMSPAYRNFRSQLVPEPTSMSVGGFSRGGSGGL